MKNIALILCCLFLSSCSSFFRAKNYSPSNKLKEISFLDEEAIKDYPFYYSDTLDNEYLRELRQNYGLDTLTSNLPNEIEKIKTIFHWSSNQWEHNGSNTPSKSDALTILKEAEDGRQFRCVEYSILTSASLNSIGIRARVVGPCSAKFATSSNFNRQFVTAILGLPRKTSGHKAITFLK